LTRLRRSDIVMPNDARMGRAHMGMVVCLPKSKTNQSVSLQNSVVADIRAHIASAHFASARTAPIRSSPCGLSSSVPSCAMHAINSDSAPLPMCPFTSPRWCNGQLPSHAVHRTCSVPYAWTMEVNGVTALVQHRYHYVWMIRTRTDLLKLKALV
jgi:hypothetical protein